MRYPLTDAEKEFRKLQQRWRRNDPKDVFSPSELIQLSEYYLEKGDLEDAKDPLEMLSGIFPGFKGREELAEANNAIQRTWQAINLLKGTFK